MSSAKGDTEVKLVPTITAPVSPLARHRQLGPNASVRVSPLCLGTMNFGTANVARMGECSKETAFEILDTFVAAGGNFIDTANEYQAEQSEKWLGEWMTLRGNRDSLVLATKFGSPYKIYDRAKWGCQSNWGGAGTKAMKKAVNESLEKLQTTYLDIIYLHWWDYTTSIPELMQSLNDLVVAGKVHYLGVSDTPAWVVTKANQYARDHGLRPFVVYQGYFNPATRDMEREIFPMCLSEGMGICAFGALAQGRLQTSASFAEREKSKEGRPFPITTREKEISALLEAIAVRKETSLQKVALAYSMAKTPYLFPIVGGRKVEHLKSNIESLKLRLSEDDVKEIESSYNFDPGFPHSFLNGSAYMGPARGCYKPADVLMLKFQGTFDWVEGPKPIQPAEV